MSGSLRARLLVGTSLGTATVLALLGVALYFSIRHALVAEFDAALLAEANALAAVAEQDGRKVSFDFDVRQMPEFSRAERPEYFELRLADGSPLARSPSLGGRALAAPAPALAGAGAAFGDAALPDGRAGRVVARAFTPRVEHDDEIRASAAAPPPLLTAVVILARDTASLGHTLGRLRWLILGLCAAAVAAAGGVLVLVVGRAMRPVALLARDIEAVRETDLSRRVRAAGVPRELAPVVGRLNALLGRLEDAFARERAFTADAAHELRTPLSGLHTTLQVCRSRTRDPGAYELAIDKCLGITGGMRSVVEGLLTLARADAGELRVARGPVDLAPLLSETWDAFRHRAAARGLRLEWHVPTALTVDADESKLRLVLNNLFDNAVSYADPGGFVRVDASAKDDGGAVVLTIDNASSRLGADDVPHLFDRFWRGDAARADTGLHCGLGLSLCQRFAALLGGSIAAEVSPGVFRIRLSLLPVRHE